MMKRVACVGLAAVLLIPVQVRPARAWYGGGAVVAGGVLGLAAGVAVGSALARPYGYYPYGYAPYPYAYYPPPVAVYPYPYAYPYPYPYAAPPAPAGYAPQPYAAPPYGAQPYAAQPYASRPTAQPTQPAPHPSCGAGYFFNTLTQNCDRS